MKMIEIQLPADLGSELEGLGLNSDSGMAEWVTDAIRQKLSAVKQLKYLELRGARGSREEFEKVLSKVPAAEPAAEDRW